MSRISAFLGLSLLSACVAPTTGPDPITAALVGRSVDYSAAFDGPQSERQVQSWTADGRTQFANGSTFFSDDISGFWKVENGTYCEIFGSQTQWRCLTVRFSDGGQSVRFREIRDEPLDWLINPWEIDRTGRFLPP